MQSLNTDRLTRNLAAAQRRVRARVRYAAQSADNYVHEHPWRAIGAALGIGLLIGLLTTRRKD